MEDEKRYFGLFGISTRIDSMALVRSVILTILAFIASYIAITSLVMYSSDQNIGQLSVGLLSSLVAAVLWGWSGLTYTKILNKIEYETE